MCWPSTTTKKERAKQHLIAKIEGLEMIIEEYRRYPMTARIKPILRDHQKRLTGALDNTLKGMRAKEAEAGLVQQPAGEQIKKSANQLH